MGHPVSGFRRNMGSRAQRLSPNLHSSARLPFSNPSVHFEETSPEGSGEMSGLKSIQPFSPSSSSPVESLVPQTKNVRERALGEKFLTNSIEDFSALLPEEKTVQGVPTPLQDLSEKKEDYLKPREMKSFSEKGEIPE